MSDFAVTSATLIAKIKDLSPTEDAATWVRFWDTYQGAMRQYAVLKVGEQAADDIVMQVLEKLVDVLRNGRYVPEKGRFHSYLTAMIVNEIRMSHRKDVARKSERHVSIDATLPGTEDATLADILVAPTGATDEQDADWRKAVLNSARERVLMHTALSDRDRQVYRAYAIEGEKIDAVARRFGLTHNAVSQIKTRIEKRIVAVGRELVEGAGL